MIRRWFINLIGCPRCDSFGHTESAHCPDHPDIILDKWEICLECFMAEDQWGMDRKKERAEQERRLLAAEIVKQMREGEL